jgi:hypothetical protein
MGEFYKAGGLGNIQGSKYPQSARHRGPRTKKAGDPKVTGFLTDDVAVDSITRKRVGPFPVRLRACCPPPGASRFRSPVTLPLQSLAGLGLSARAETRTSCLRVGGVPTAWVCLAGCPA